MEPQMPQGMTYLGSLEGGNNAVSGASVMDYLFKMISPITGRECEVILPYDPTFMSKAEVEDLAAQSFETFLEDEKEREMKRKPTAEERKDIGKAIEEFRKYTAKMRESTNYKIGYRGI
jgi:hypothetical protein